MYLLDSRKRENRMVSGVRVCMWVVLISAAFVSCDSWNPVAPETNRNDSMVHSFEKEPVVSYPVVIEDTSRVYTWSRRLRAYHGGQLDSETGSCFCVPPASIIPPDDFPLKEPITIRMVVRQVSENEFRFVFHPSETRFLPAARLELCWKTFPIKNEELLFNLVDNDGEYIAYDDPRSGLANVVIDYSNQKIIFYIKHFSRYALSTGTR